MSLIWDEKKFMEIFTLSLEESTRMVISAQTEQSVSTGLFLTVCDYNYFVWSLTLASEIVLSCLGETHAMY